MQLPWYRSRKQKEGKYYYKAVKTTEPMHHVVFIAAGIWSTIPQPAIQNSVSLRLKN
jgi:hypothetical protein